MKPPRRILILRLSAIGDTIHTLPLAAAIKERLPQCRLGWVVEKPAAPLIENNPLVDYVRVLPKGWLKRPGEVLRLRRDLREQRFDVVFDVQGLSKSAIAAKLSGAPIRVGFSRGESREIAPFLDNWLISPLGRHAVDKTLSLLSALGQTPPAQPQFVFPPCPDDDAARIDLALAKPEYRNGYIIMGPWGSFAGKRWPIDRYADLASRLYGKTGLPTLVLGHGDAERTAAAEAFHSVNPPGAPSPLGPDVSPAGIVDLARRARLFVGSDSFPMHAAAGVGCPTIGLFSVTDPERLGPYGPNGKAVFEKLTLVKSTRERATLDDSAIKSLSVNTVLAACLDFLINY